MHFRPKHISIQLTSYCNWNCGVCSSKKHNDKEHMSYAVFHKLIKDIQSMTPNPIDIKIGQFFGEPTAHPHFISMMKLLNDTFRNTSIRVLTNGSLLTPQLLNQLPERVVIAVSVLGEKQIYHELTGNSWDNLLTVCDYLENSGRPIILFFSSNNEQNIITSLQDFQKYSNVIVLLSKLYGSGTESIDILKDINTHQQIKYFFRNQPQFKIYLWDDNNKFDDHMKNNAPNNMFVNNKKINNSYCNVPMNNTYILYNGDVTICSLPSPTMRFPALGNIMNDTLYNIINAFPMYLITERLLKGVSGCKYCKHVCGHRFYDTN